MKPTVHRLSAERREDFYRLHSTANGCEWCCCAAWWVPTWEEFSSNTAPDNRRLRNELFDAGEFDGYLGYVDDIPVAWLQVGRRDRLSKLVQQYALEPDPGAWAITCLLVAPSYRHQRMAQQLLSHVIGDLRNEGVERLEAFPRRGEGHEDGEVWTGPERLYTSAGFRVVRDHHEWPIVRLDLVHAGEQG